MPSQIEHVAIDTRKMRMTKSAIDAVRQELNSVLKVCRMAFGETDMTLAIDRALGSARDADRWLGQVIQPANNDHKFEP